jgi:hypothetical protein
MIVSARNLVQVVNKRTQNGFGISSDRAEGLADGPWSWIFVGMEQAQAWRLRQLKRLIL